MAKKGVKEQIQTLLSSGKSSGEVIAMGYRPGTVYTAQRELRERDARPARESSVKESGGAEQDRIPASSPRKEESIESDPEIVALKKEVRKTELRRELDKLEVPTDMEQLLACAKATGTEKGMFCAFNEDGMCTAEEWQHIEEVPQHAGKPIEHDGLWHARPSPFFCLFCAAELGSTLYEMKTACPHVVDARG